MMQTQYSLNPMYLLCSWLLGAKRHTRLMFYMSGLAVVLILVTGQSRANVMYDIDISTPTITVAGTITTDGTFGNLTLGNFLGWDLGAAGTNAGYLNFDSTAGSYISCDPFPLFGDGSCGFSADANQLIYDATAGYDVSITSPYGLLNLKSNSIILSNLGTQSKNTESFPGQIVIGTSIVSAVPEPESYAMLLAGLGLIGFIACRKNASSRMDFT